MGNLIPLIILGGRGKEVILHEKAHILHNEVAGVSAVAGTLPLATPGERGILRVEEVKTRIKGGAYNTAHTALVAIENTHNFEGGSCWQQEDLRELQHRLESTSNDLRAKRWSALGRTVSRSQKLVAQFTGVVWQWSTMAYYMGQEPDLRDRVIKYAWLDHAPLPWQVKAVWAHHRYLLGRVKT
jgi:hypothetical protein